MGPMLGPVHDLHGVARDLDLAMNRLRCVKFDAVLWQVF
jgi:hypothetical protein